MPSPHRRPRTAGIALLVGALLTTVAASPAAALRVGPNAPTTPATTPAAATSPTTSPPTAAPTTSTGGDDLSAQHLAAVAEQYNLARLKVERASAAVVDAERRIDDAQRRVDVVKARVRARAAAIYRGAGGSTITLPIPSGGDFSERARRHAYLDAAQNPDRDLIEQLSAQLSRLRTERDSARAAHDQLEHEAEAAAQLKRRLDGLAAKAAAAARANAATTTGDGAGPVGTPSTGAPAGTPGTTGGTTATTRPGTPPTTRPATPPTTTPSNPTGGGTGGGTNPPPPSGRAATAIAFARAQLGKPYVFAAAGPNAFDCSGLTMAAWAAAGVRMPHYSGSQATMFPKVSWDQLQPGDIVVFYSDLHHVGLYIGGGMMIHAPQTGDVVKIAPAWRTTFMWGVRPG